MRIFLSNHAKRRLKARLGTHRGDAIRTAHNAWNSKRELTPEQLAYINDHIQFNRKRFHYRNYADDCLFIFTYNVNKVGDVYGRDLVLVTVLHVDEDEEP